LGLDRLLRVLRSVVFNFGYFKLKPATELDAHVEVLSSDFLRITLYRPSHFHWFPGQTVYLTIPGISTLPFEAHPFTIATLDTPHVAADVRKTNDEELKLAMRTGSHMEGFKQLVFHVRVRNGFTKRLLRAARDDSSMRVILDGPYGSPELLKGFGTALLIAGMSTPLLSKIDPEKFTVTGGSGISFTLPLFLDIVQYVFRPLLYWKNQVLKNVENRRAQSGKGECSKIVFVWAIRDSSEQF
jgi:ferric-chelate reductase